MKKTFLILVIVAIATAVASGKIVRRQLSIFQASVPETETLAPENMEFVYDYRCCVDTTGSLEDNISSDNMLLQIGPDGLSKFSSYKNLTVDSILMRSTQEQIADAAIEGKLSTGEFMTIYKNWPAGRLTIPRKSVRTGSATRRRCLRLTGNLPIRSRQCSAINVRAPDVSFVAGSGRYSTPRISRSWRVRGNSMVCRV